ncbi:MAG: SLC13 family permease [Fimbriimonadales bacterium]|nr:SLC13 family permease [Fimbriimonadales bacterium]
MWQQTFVFAVLGVCMALFFWGKWRYDLVAAMALMAVALTGIVSPKEAFSGFSHPAVNSVGAILVVSQGLSNCGVTRLLVAPLASIGKNPTLALAAMVGAVIVASAFMNNVGALALMMPVAIKYARDHEQPVGKFLMPLAFGSLLGGLMTMLGTPPNLIIATFRAENGSGAFGMFDFLPVGGVVAAFGAIYLVLLGWRLIPIRQRGTSREGLYEIGEYLTEVMVPEDSEHSAISISELASENGEDVQIVALVRGERRIAAPRSNERILPGDTLIVEASAEDIQAFVERTGYQLAEGKHPSEESLSSDNIEVEEAVVTARSPVIGKTVKNIRLRSVYGVNLLAIARQGQSVRRRLDSTGLRQGDVLLLQGSEGALSEVMQSLALLPLATRKLRFGAPPRLALGVATFAAAVVLVTVGVLPVQLAFAAAAVVMLTFGLLSLKQAYDTVDWPVIMLLACMMPVGYALESTGGAQTLANLVTSVAGNSGPIVALAVVMVGAMTLSDVINNAAAAVLLAPIGISVAESLGVSSDPFLIAIALGASCAFLTPIGHQSNTLVMGPGGYRFSDYWRVGLPLQIAIFIVALPMILRVWPF